MCTSKRRRARFVPRHALIVVALLVIGSARGQELQDPDAKQPPAGVRVGSFGGNMEERSPLSAIKIVCGRLGWDFERVKLEKQEQDYDVTKESFEAYVPADYDGSTPYGLICFVNSGGGGRVNETWRPLLDKYKYIWVAPNNNGNNRAVWCRIGVAIDATHHIMKRFNIDPERVYCAGGSGGGRTSSMMGITYPDLYRGGIYVIGMNYYRTLPATNEPGKVWRATYARPGPDLYRLAKERSVHVALEGDSDINRFQAKAIIEAYQKEGFKQTYYFEEPGVGHSMPSREWVEKAFVALEEGRKKVAESGAVAGGKSAVKPVAPKAATATATSSVTATEDVAGELAKAKELAAKDAVAGYEAYQALVRKHPKAPEVVQALEASDKLLAADPKLKKTIESRAEADRLLRVAQVYVQNRMYGQARGRLQQIVDGYPQTPASLEAKKLLGEIGTK